MAPGEAEAECALLQQKGIVDAVLSEDVDTLMFGSGQTLRNWSAEGSLTAKVPTHVNLYDADKTKAGKSGLDREGMILVALMSGGDYIPEGIPGCGPKTACEAARAGFGADLCQLPRNDHAGIALWKERLARELKTNESKFFKSKHKTLVIPEDFPRKDVMGYYTHPCVSSPEKLAKLVESLQWDQNFDIPGLRTFVGEAFDWTCISGAKKFIRNLAPCLLVKQLRMRGEGDGFVSDDPYEIAIREAQLVKSIYAKRNHITTDGVTELRIGFIPLELVKIDLDAEEPDPELSNEDIDSDNDEVVIALGPDTVSAVDGNFQEPPSSPKKKRSPSSYDPTQLEKIWLLETFVRVGVPLKVEDFEETFRNATKYEAMKAARKRTEQQAKMKKRAPNGGMPKGALDAFTRVMKPGTGIPQGFSHSKSQEAIAAPNTLIQSAQKSSKLAARTAFRAPPTLPDTPPRVRVPYAIEILSSPESNTMPQKRPFRRSQSDTSTIFNHQSLDFKVATGVKMPVQAAAPCAASDLEPVIELPPSVTKRRQRTPLRRTKSIPSAGFGSPYSPATPPAKRLSTFRKPVDPPDQPSLHEMAQPFQAPNTLGAHPNPKEPSTPRKTATLHLGSSTSEDIINISSSPVTPRSKQKLITKWLSPHARPPVYKQHLNRPTVELIDEENPDSNRAAESPKAFSRLSSSEVSAKPPKASAARIPPRIPEDTALQEREHNPRRSPRGHKTVAWKQHERKKNVIRLRKSLEGAWKLDEAQSSKLSISPTKNRQRAVPGDADREWRLSQVEVLDLSAI